MAVRAWTRLRPRSDARCLAASGKGDRSMTTYLAGPRAELMVGGGPLLTAKVVPPTTSAALVERPRLLQLLTAAAAEPLTLVCAPAGSGKTVLAARWAAGAAPPGAVA